MVRAVSVILLITLTSKGVSQEYSSVDILLRSKNFYISHPSGQFSVKTIFKSPIAESFSVDSMSVKYCRDKNVYVLASGHTMSYLPEGKYYFIDDREKRFIDFSSDTDFVHQRYNIINQYPHINLAFFDRFKMATFKFKWGKDGLWMYNLSDQFILDTLNWSIISYRNVSWGIEGLQIKEWKVLDPTYHHSCSSSDLPGFPASYTQVQSFNTSPSKLSLKGENFWNLIGDEKLVLDDGSALDTGYVSGRHLLVDFFYQSCMPCILSFKSIKELKPFIDENRLAVVGIDPVLYDSSSMKKFKTRYNLSHPVLLGQKAAKVNQQLHIDNAYPYFLLIDPSGLIIEEFSGYSEGFFDCIKQRLKI